VGVTWYAARSSILHKTSNFDGKTFEQVAREVIGPTGVGVKVIGTLNATPFARLQNEPGETVWNFLERIARVRGIVMGSDHLGNFLLIDWHECPVTADLQEGFNILRCQATIAMKDVNTQYIIRGQKPASDESSGTEASEMEATAEGTAKRYSPILTPAEQPVWGIGELQDRANHEAIWHEGSIVTATITVQGWMRPLTNDIWLAGDAVTVHTPLAMLNGQVMIIQTATFTQDRNAGTQTTLDLVVPWLMKGRTEFNPSTPGFAQPGAATPGSAPATTPPAANVPDPPAVTLPPGPG